MVPKWQRMADAYVPQFKKYNNEFVVSRFSASEFADDPTYWLFRLARYKHCSRMLEGLENVLEIGSGDCLASAMVASKVKKLTCCEEFPDLCEYSKIHIPKIAPNISIINCSFPPAKNEDKEYFKNLAPFDAIYSCDVFEHIDPKDSHAFLRECVSLLKTNGVYISGIPSLESQKYASEGSKIGHVNCLSKNEYKAFLQNYFDNVFVFGMNDEVLHTGYGAMSHYLLALCTNPKNNI